MKNLLKNFMGVAAALAALTLSTATAHAQSTWDAIQERGTLRIGVTQAPPWFTKDVRTGEWTGGLGITLGQKMAEALEVELETVEVTWGTSIAALQSNKIDLMYFLSPTASRARTVDFTLSPVVFLSQAVLAAEGVDASTWEGLNNADTSISVPQATSMDQFLTRMASNADIQRFPDNAASIAAFQSGPGGRGFFDAAATLVGATKAGPRGNLGANPCVHRTRQCCRTPGRRQDLARLARYHDLLLV